LRPQAPEAVQTVWPIVADCIRSSTFIPFRGRSSPFVADAFREIGKNWQGTWRGSDRRPTLWRSSESRPGGECATSRRWSLPRQSASRTILVVDLPPN